MQLSTGKSYLISTTDWFYAPDGEAYRAIFGTIVEDPEHVNLDVVNIGNVTIPKNHIMLAVQTPSVSSTPPHVENSFEGRHFTERGTLSRIYHAG